MTEERRTPEMEESIARGMAAAAEASESAFQGEGCPCGALALIEAEARYFHKAADEEPTAAGDHLRALAIYMGQLAERLRQRMVFADRLRRGVGESE